MVWDMAPGEALVNLSISCPRPAKILRGPDGLHELNSRLVK